MADFDRKSLAKETQNWIDLAISQDSLTGDNHWANDEYLNSDDD